MILGNFPHSRLLLAPILSDDATGQERAREPIMERSLQRSLQEAL
jgi:hypothetical protein